MAFNITSLGIIVTIAGAPWKSPMRRPRILTYAARP